MAYRLPHTLQLSPSANPSVIYAVGLPVPVRASVTKRSAASRIQVIYS
ncbi:hypothetical protein [Bacillus glycinifermentans]|uniref:Uncharacterized protein n=1 Tax=Bacillus glycinifermentans TaxID=1664069 RepID=A0ABU6H5P1_9BACI|nr:hypothetical protein [Bacillus glycinifermentans]MEC0485227.1 hypothetical protein [Bacillus glycinifermentans]MEC0495587.1 hypothetical protein [Bacillus glycinifermentans]MEC0540180.1 hypothetical protein [Bacillus glycinifermentans]MEC3607133.1 hypothetical protein [Bacillus glycinifermentans]UOY89057.1 hypothetical protein MW696_02000 [Bacillus glycinifermentans]